MSMQGGAQEPESPDKPDEQIPGQPGTMPDDPSPAPEAPDMPSDPDRDPSQSPPNEAGSSWLHAERLGNRLANVSAEV
jgi:hypothetical protein